MTFFKKDYWFSSPKGYFRVRITDDDVLMEHSPEKFISASNLWMTRKEYQNAHDPKKKELIKLQHMNEYSQMLIFLATFKSVIEQDEYIKKELRVQGYIWVR